MRYEAVLFDCDGVLVDSEPIVNRVLRAMLAERGWLLSEEECLALFVGRMVRDERARIERHTGQPLTEDWLAPPCSPTCRRGMRTCFTVPASLRCSATWPICRPC
jgi:phosphoglycolate phosphatase-like HAD superfamily hydrolase